MGKYHHGYKVKDALAESRVSGGGKRRAMPRQKIRADKGRPSHAVGPEKEREEGVRGRRWEVDRSCPGRESDSQLCGCGGVFVWSSKWRRERFLSPFRSGLLPLGSRLWGTS